MVTEEFINKEFAPLKPSESVTHALTLMGEWNLSTLPVVEPTTGKLIGQVTRDKLDEVANPGDPISTVQLEEAPFLFPHQHIFEAARSMLVHETGLLPVVDANQSWLGVLEKTTAVEALTSMLNIGVPGSVIEVEVEAQDYSLSQLVHLIEQEGARILGVAVRAPRNTRHPFLVSFKLNLNDTSAVSQSLRRHGFRIRSESNSDLLNTDISDRADELIRYLDV